MTTTISRAIALQSVVDWNNDADFSDTAEDVSAYVAAQPGLTVEFGLDSARSLAPPRMNTAGNELLNGDQRFSSEFPGSPIYQLMLPGRAVEHRMIYGGDVLYNSDDYYDDTLLYNGSAQKTIFTGVVDDLPQFPEANRKRVGLSALGTLTKLRGRRRFGRAVSTQLYSNVTTGTAVGYVLDAAGWPAGKRSIDAGSTILLYWWLDEQEPYQALLDLLQIEGPQANLWEDGDGVLHFEGRNFRSTTTRSLTSQLTVYDTSQGSNLGYEEDVAYETNDPYNGNTGIYHIRPFAYDQGFRNVINACTFETVQRALQGLAVVWTYGAATITVLAGVPKVLKAKPSNPFQAAVCTNGADATTSSGTLNSVTLSRASGGNTDITLTSAAGCVVNLLQLRAQALTVSSTTTIPNSTDTSGSIAIYGQQDYAITARTDVDVNTAQDIANAVVARYQIAQPSVAITLINVDAAHVYEQFTRTISDRITIHESHTGVSWDAHINQITHRSLEGGLWHYTTFACEKAPLSADAYAYVWDAGVSTWGSATWGT